MNSEGDLDACESSGTSALYHAVSRLKRVNQYVQFLQSNQVKRTPQDDINELIIRIYIVNQVILAL